MLATWRRRLARSRFRRTASVTCGALGVVLWLGFAPAALGGTSTYVTTYGTSMEPTLQAGDLVVVKPQDSYRVGDVVAYRSASLGTVVLHRIIAREGDRYVFQGDNNSWIDDERPTEADLIGAMDTHVSGLGERVQQVRSPGGIAAVAGVGLVPTAVTARARRRRRGKERSERPAAPRRRPSLGHVEPRLVVAAGVALLVTGFAFTRPTIVESANDVPFDEQGAFSYTAPAAGAPAVYPDGEVTSGQPIFLNLVERIDITFDYRISSEAPLLATGDVALRASISDTSGWSYPFELAGPVAFAADNAQIRGSIDLTDLRSRIADMEAATGAARDTYTVAVQAAVNREITGLDASSTGSFAPSLDFRLDELEMYLVEPGQDALNPVQGGLITTEVERRGEVRVLGQSISTGALRAGSLGLLVILLALLAESVHGSMRSRDESKLIQRRYRNYLLPLRSIELTQSAIVDVESIAALARLADHTAGPILSAGPGSEAYYVVDGPRVYRYRAAVALDVAEAAEPVTTAVLPSPPPAPAPSAPRRRTEPLRVRKR